MTKTFSEDLRSLILNCTEPFIVKDILNWNVLKWDLEYWSEIINEEELDFRCGKYKYTMKPQWERNTKIVKKTFKEFSEFDVKCNNRWLYFDYKYLNEYFKDRHELHNCISWNIFGFPEFNSEESTLWIGSEAAHTSCHKDTYGCNLVAQIYGRKRWIMFPPEEDLFSTRIPYEESSIYSKLNFFSPDNVEKFQNIKRCKSVILEPGEVLVIPNGWWHYVENLEMAISINVWIPLPTDSKRQLKESLVQMFVSQIIKDMATEDQKMILNPNMEKLNLQTQSIYQSVNLINICKENCKTSISDRDCCVKSNELFKKYKVNLTHITDLSKDDFINLLENQRNRFKHDICEEENVNMLNNDLKNVIDAFTDENVINFVVENILNNEK